MTEDRKIPEAVATHLRWPVRLTRAGMVAERITRGFWPVWTILFAVLAAFAFGVQDHLPIEAVWAGLGLSGLALLGFAARTLRGFHWPTEAEALDRIDARLAGRPIAALTDAQALGGSDSGSTAVWQAHLARMAERARAARRVEPDLRVASRDPFALRYAALTAAVLAVLFGSLWRVGEAAQLVAGGKPVKAAGGPSWEGWVEPPAYTGKPSLYLANIEAGALEIPEGSRVTVRLYGTPGDLAVRETVSGTQPAPEAAAPAADAAASGSGQAASFDALQSGVIEVSGPGGRAWDVTVLPDAAPTVAFSGEMGREALGQMAQPFTATDDHAVTAGRAIITLDMGALDRRFGLASEPEPVADLVFDLPMPLTGKRDRFEGTLAEDASKSIMANMPVRMVLEAEDGRGQIGRSEERALTLPGRRFFDPVAAAVIEMRRDLLWTRQNGKRVAQILHALTNRPEGFMRNGRAYLMLRVAMRRLDAAVAQGFSPEMRDEMAEALWQIAVLIEDGGLNDALMRMQQAQERLSEAIRNGASPEEIQRLMDELKQATDQYIQMLAERSQSQPQDEMAQGQQQGQQITGDQIQQMMDEIQRLMEEGRMAEAQELLEQFNRMMENLQVTQGQGGQGMQGPGSQAMEGLAETLRDQQGLSDESFRNLQEQFDPNANSRGQRPGQNRTPGQQPGQGQGQGDQPQGQDGQSQDGQGQDGQPQDRNGDGRPDQPGEGPGGLAERQQALRDQLRNQQGAIPDTLGPEGEAARDSVDRAGRAMEEAAEALRDGDMAGALDRQAEAIERLREGMRSLGEAMAQNQQDQPGGQGQLQGQQAQREVPRDPLGRTTGQTGRIGSDENLLQGEDVYRRARDILDEIRRRAGEQGRPTAELDYLKRLLDRF